MEKNQASKEHLADVLNSHPFIEWAVERQKELMWGFALAIVAIMLLIRFAGYMGTQSENDYLQAEKNLGLIFESTSKDQQDPALEQLQSIVAAHPDLQTVYDGTIAQVLVVKDKPNQAAPYLERALSRTTDQELPLFAQFAKISLLAQEKKWDEALNESQTLKTSLKNQTDTPLYALNLLRIAFINQQMGNSAGQKAALKEWDAKKGTAGFKKVTDAFNQAKVPLDEYLKKF